MLTEQFVLEFGTPVNTPPAGRKASEIVRKLLLDVLPPGVPPNFRKVTRARFARGRVIAELEMVDGLAAEVEAWQWRPGAWAHKWLRLDGGDLSWEAEGWTRFPGELPFHTTIRG